MIDSFFLLVFSDDGIISKRFHSLILCGVNLGFYDDVFSQRYHGQIEVAGACGLTLFTQNGYILACLTKTGCVRCKVSYEISHSLHEGEIFVSRDELRHDKMIRFPNSVQVIRNALCGYITIYNPINTYLLNLLCAVSKHITAVYVIYISISNPNFMCNIYI